MVSVDIHTLYGNIVHFVFIDAIPQMYSVLHLQFVVFLDSIWIDCVKQEL